MNEKMNFNQKNYAKTLSLCLAGLAAAIMLFRPAIAAGIPSCYDMVKIPKPATPPKTDLVVLVDQTTLLDDRLKNQVIENVQRNIEGGNAFSIIVFSAFINNKYTEQVAYGMIDYPMLQAQRDDTGKVTLRKFDTCLSQQQAYAKKLVAKVLAESFATTNERIERSDILAALADVSKVTVQSSKSPNKVVFMVSDMLENSSVTSFYAHNIVSMINHEAEFKKVLDANLRANFGGAKIFVLGAGIIPVDLKHPSLRSYRPTKTMQALKSFWQSYFQKSNAVLVEFGQPALLGKVE
jgi:hypothetical protein